MVYFDEYVSQNKITVWSSQYYHIPIARLKFLFLYVLTALLYLLCLYLQTSRLADAL